MARDFEGVAFTNDTREPQPDRKEPQAWHAKMTCHKRLKVGHITTFFENEKVSHSNVQDGETQVTNEDAVLELIVAEQEGYNEDYYADLFLIEEQEHRSASFHTKDDINDGRIPKEWILLDSQSTTDAFSNPSLLKNIHEVQGSLTIHTQAGKAITKLKGTIPGYGEVWYCPDGIANILSLAHIAKTRLVRFYSTNGNQFEVMKDDGSTRIFKQSEHGLY
jgi:membrane-bound lytic murein transglycosylase